MFFCQTERTFWLTPVGQFLTELCLVFDNLAMFIKTELRDFRDTNVQVRINLINVRNGPEWRRRI